MRIYKNVKVIPFKWYSKKLKKYISYRRGYVQLPRFMAGVLIVVATYDRIYEARPFKCAKSSVIRLNSRYINSSVELNIRDEDVIRYFYDKFSEQPIPSYGNQLRGCIY